VGKGVGTEAGRVWLDAVKDQAKAGQSLWISGAMARGAVVMPASLSTCRGLGSRRRPRPSVLPLASRASGRCEPAAGSGRQRPTPARSATMCYRVRRLGEHGGVATTVNIRRATVHAVVQVPDGPSSVSSRRWSQRDEVLPSVTYVLPEASCPHFLEEFASAGR